MMWRTLPLVLAVALLTNPVRANEPVLDLFRGYLEALRIQAGIPGLSAALVGREAIIWEQGFGSSDLERRIPVTSDTPFHLDGLTQIFTATIVLRCIERGLFSMDARVDAGEEGVEPPTVWELLTHTTMESGVPVFHYNPGRLDPLRSFVRQACLGDSFRETLATDVELLGMLDSVPGPDAVRLAPPAEGIPFPSQRERYVRTLERLAVPYAVSDQKRAFRSAYAVQTLSPGSGLISTASDLAKFDLALKQARLVDAGLLGMAWRNPAGGGGQPLPHGVGWFVQTYNGETIVWQYGVQDNAASSLIVTVPARGLTLILLANSSGLVRPFSLDKGELMASPFGRLFLGLLVQ
jgi:CubicO group peptidase (beta-lactamase class C family)